MSGFGRQGPQSRRTPALVGYRGFRLLRLQAEYQVLDFVQRPFAAVLWCITYRMARLHDQLANERGRL